MPAPEPAVEYVVHHLLGMEVNGRKYEVGEVVAEEDEETVKDNHIMMGLVVRRAKREFQG